LVYWFIGLLFMQKKYWEFSPENLEKIAIIDERGSEINFAKLEQEINEFINKLPDYKALVFSKVSNSKASIITYLACLKAGHPLLLLDSNLSDDLFDALVTCYNPNLICCEGEVKKCHSVRLKLNTNLSLLLSTSGSTGSPKLVRLSADNLQSNAESIAQYLRITCNDRAITTLPMNYSYGLSVINSHFYKGAAVVLSEDGIISRELWQKITTFNVTSMAGVPFLYQMLKKLKYKRFNTQGVRYITQAGGKLDIDTINYFKDECSKKEQEFIVMYGQTEATARMSYVPFERLSTKAGSIGIAIPNGKLSIVNTNGELIKEPLVEGEIHYEGPNVMLGYAESLSDLALGDKSLGKLHTGDLGYFDDDGFFFITGRLKRFIKMYGLRLSLDSIEAWLVSKKYNAVATGLDDQLVICLVDEVDQVELKKLLVDEYKININNIEIKMLVAIPRTANDKVDYKLLLNREGNK
jgi:long-chain acyl-CoA synthetase